MSARSLIVSLLLLVLSVVAAAQQAATSSCAGNGFGSILSTMPNLGLSSPNGIVIDETTGLLYVADTLNNRIMVVSTQFNEPITSWNASNPDLPDTTAFTAPQGIAIDISHRQYPFDVFYVADTGVDSTNNLIAILDASGNSVTNYTDENIINPLSVAVDSYNNIYVVDSNSERDNIVVLNDNGITSLVDFSQVYATSVVVDSFNRIYVTDPSIHGFWIFSGNAGSSQKFPGISIYPNAIAIDSNGYIYLSDSSAPGLMVLDNKGNQACYLPLNFSIGNGGLTIDSNNNLYVTDNSNNRIVLLQGMNVPTPPSTSTPSPTLQASSSSAASASVSSSTGIDSLSSSSTGTVKTPLSGNSPTNGGSSHSLTGSQLAGVIVGSIVGGVALAALLLVLYFYATRSGSKPQKAGVGLPATSSDSAETSISKA